MSQICFAQQNTSGNINASGGHFESSTGDHTWTLGNLFVGTLEAPDGSFSIRSGFSSGLIGDGNNGTDGDCPSNFYDCLGVCDGTAIMDDCGVCLEITDPQYNDCLCDELIVMEAVLCDDATNSYEVLFTINHIGDNGISLVDNNIGVSIAIDEQNITLGPFPPNSGYSFTLTSIDHPNCSQTFSNTIVSCVVTSIDLLSFDGRVQEKENHLYWSSASEDACDHFIIERSENGIDFKPIGQLDCKGNSTIIQEYSFSDAQFSTKTNHYRLREVNQEGISKLVSNVVTLVRKDFYFEIVSTAPIPATNYIDLAFTSLQNGEVDIQVYDVAGKVVGEESYQAMEGLNTTRIDLTQYVTGIYLMTLTSPEQGRLVTRFIKEK